jgi:hypothetical protein
MHNVGMETQNMVGNWGDQENFVKHVIFKYEIVVQNIFV